jgi:hypothetical protein
MPFEPISIFGIIGTTAGLLGFLVNTVDSIGGRLRNYQECVKKLQEYSHTVDSACLELEAWFNLWTRNENRQYNPYNADVYELLWGRRGPQTMIIRLDIIRLEREKIANLLQFQDIRDSCINWTELGENVNGPSNEELRDWRLVIEQSAIGRDPLPGHAQWSYKFLFAIYRNTDLKERIKNLQERVKELKEVSNSLWASTHEDRAGAPKEESIQQTVALHQERQELLRFLDELRQGNNDPQRRWAIVMGNPSLRLALSRFRGKSRSQLDFIFKGHTASGVENIKIAYPRSARMQPYEVLNAVQSCSSTNKKNIGYDSRLQDQSLLPTERLTLRHVDLLDVKEMWAYTLAALTAARSTILLYQSSWIDGLCFCGMSLHSSREERLTMAYFPHAQCLHVDHESRKDVFLLLAILLAELAIGAPIKVYHSDTRIGLMEPEFEIPEELYLSGYSGRMSWSTLCDMLNERRYNVPEHFVSVDYEEAMNYCYRLSRKLTTRKFVDDDLEICIARIETP